MESFKNIIVNSPTPSQISQNPLKIDEGCDDYSLSHVVQLGSRRKADETATDRYYGDYEGLLPSKPPNFQPSKVLKRGNSSAVTQDINWVVGELRKAPEGSRAKNMAAPNNIQQHNEIKEVQNTISDDYMTAVSKKNNGLFNGVCPKAAGVSWCPSLKILQPMSSRFGRSAGEFSSSSTSKQTIIHQQQHHNPIPNYFQTPPNPNPNYNGYNDHQITFPAVAQENPTSDEYSEEEVAWLKQILLSPDRADDQNLYI